MKSHPWTERLRKTVCSLAAGCFVVWWGQSGPRPRAEPSAPPLPPEATPAPTPTRFSSHVTTPTPFAIDGLPMAMETLELRSCDTTTWTPENTVLWAADSMLLSLDHSPEEASATWLDSASSVHHAARLVCRGDGSGELHHFWTAIHLSATALESALAPPVTERTGPIPLLADHVQLFTFRNLDWTLYLDEPKAPPAAVDHMQAALLARGWRTQKIPAQAWQKADAEGLLDGRVLVRGDSLCLVHRLQLEEPAEGSTDGPRDLLFVACRGTL